MKTFLSFWQDKDTKAIGHTGDEGRNCEDTLSSPRQKGMEARSWDGPDRSKISGAAKSTKEKKQRKPKALKDGEM